MSHTNLPGLALELCPPIASTFLPSLSSARRPKEERADGKGGGGNGGGGNGSAGFGGGGGGGGGGYWMMMHPLLGVLRVHGF